MFSLFGGSPVVRRKATRRKSVRRKATKRKATRRKATRRKAQKKRVAKGRKRSVYGGAKDGEAKAEAAEAKAQRIAALTDKKSETVTAEATEAAEAELLSKLQSRHKTKVSRYRKRSPKGVPKGVTISTAEKSDD